MEIVRSHKPFSRLTLLAALGAGVTDLVSSERELSFGVAERVRWHQGNGLPSPCKDE